MNSEYGIKTGDWVKVICHELFFSLNHSSRPLWVARYFVCFDLETSDFGYLLLFWIFLNCAKFPQHRQSEKACMSFKTRCDRTRDFMVKYKENTKSMKINSYPKSRWPKPVRILTTSWLWLHIAGSRQSPTVSANFIIEIRIFPPWTNWVCLNFQAQIRRQQGSCFQLSEVFSDTEWGCPNYSIFVLPN